MVPREEAQKRWREVTPQKPLYLGREEARKRETREGANGRRCMGLRGGDVRNLQLLQAEGENKERRTPWRSHHALAVSIIIAENNICEPYWTARVMRH